MANKKIIFGMTIITMVILIICFSSFGLDEENSNAPYLFRGILACSLEGFSEEQCASWDVVVGMARYNITLMEGREPRPKTIKFPLSTELEESSSIARDKILCDDSEAVGIAKFNPEDNKWYLLSDSQIIEESVETGTLQLMATIESPGLYAVVRKDPLRVQGMLIEGDKICVRSACSSYRSFESEPYDGNAREGSINLRLCKILPGCTATGGDRQGCDANCMQFSDSDCTGDCTNAEDGCCLPLQDGECDLDCWQKREKDEPEGILVYSTDPDCMLGPDSEKYHPYGEGDGFDEMKEIPFQFESRSASWAEFIINEDDFDTDSLLLEGNIKIVIDEGDGIWLKDFAYTDLKGNEAMLFPLRSSIRGISADDLPLGGALGSPYEFSMYPALLYQHADETDESQWKNVQFDLPPTGVRNITFLAKKRGDNPVVKFSIVVTAHGDESADYDNDGYSNYEDCNDNNPYTYPGADEICDNMDNDCNGYRRYNTSAFDPKLGLIDFNWNADNRNTDGCWGSERCHFVMPCDGSLHFWEIDDSSYLEVWRQDKRLCECGEKTCGHENSVSCDASLGSNGPWESYQAVSAFGNDGAAKYAIYADGDDNPTCIVGAHASCKAGAVTPDFSRASSVSGNNGYYDDEYRIFNNDGFLISSGDNDGDTIWGAGTILNSDENLIRLKQGDMVWGMTWGCGKVDGDYCHDKTFGPLGYCCWTPDWGGLKFSVRCYDQIEEIAPEFIDEGLSTCERRTEMPLEVHFCGEPEFADYADDIFDFENKKCKDADKILCEPVITFNGVAECIHSTEGEALDSHNFYVYACPKCPEGTTCPELDCFEFYSGSYNVCAEKEKCSGVAVNPDELNKDMDCDGLTPFWEDEAGNVDLSRPKDPDCIDVDLTGECDAEQRKWYKSEADGWTEDGYCLQCGDRDSSCTKACEPGQKSCDGGCLPDACDIAADKWCKNGAWTSTGYEAKCKAIDSEYSTTDCTPNSCDVEFNLTCHAERWKATGGAGVAYCDLPACKGKDVSCAKPCTAGTCDVYSNAYCRTTGAWSANNAADYCSECGALDSNCGSNVCSELEDGSPRCDIPNKKVCINEEWKIDMVNYCEECGALDETTCQPRCLPNPDDWTDTETNCTDGIDNDCNTKADCADPICNYLEECRNACVPLETDNCGPSEGICSPGERICSMGGRWGECVGGTAPMTEVCNSVDDDCDGTIDEGCVCTNGQSQPCGFDSGSCRSGVQRCEEGKWGTCWRSSRQRPTTEVCDGFDNDCDGEIDEVCPCQEGSNQSCGGAPGTICKAGMQACTDGKLGTCVGEVKPMKEDKNTGNTCSDGIDNDCDTKADSADEGCSVTPADQITPSCFDAKKNQGEDEVDCGGPCSACVSPADCNNRKMDPGEEGVDCGGECSVPCNERTRLRSAPSDEETEEETTEEPTCGDGYCDSETEDIDTCAEDCAEAKGTSLTALLIPAIIIIGLALGIFFAYKKGIIKVKGAKPEAKPAFPAPKGAATQSNATKPSQAARMPSAAIKAAAQKAPPKREIKTREELELEKSFNEEKALLKK